MRLGGLWWWWWWRWRRRWWWCTAAVVKRPFTSKNPSTERCEKLEKTFGHVETTVRAARTLVHDNSACGLAVRSDGNMLEAIWTRIAAAILSRVQGDDKIAGDIGLATSTKSDVVPSVSCVGKPFRQLRGSSLCDSIVSARNMMMGTSKYWAQCAECDES